MSIDIVVAFFLLGVIARLLKSPFTLPEALYKSLTIILMLAIGLKGGVALAKHASANIITQSLWVVSLGVILPLIAFVLAYAIGRLRRIDAASLAAHYGSVSVGTYAVAVAVLENRGIAYEAYFPLFVVLLEMPAIAVGLALANSPNNSANKSTDKREVLHEVFFNQGMVLMTGGLLIGYACAQQMPRISPLFIDLFPAVLALFLLEMGMVAADRIRALKDSISFLITFAIAMPLIGALFGAAIANVISLSPGGVILLAVLGASASYIAVPAAMRAALPEADHGMSITASLGVTFPFNVIVGIPLYITLVEIFLA
ncbi:sodium-dependent bicarbonate transport family permease [Litorivivens sp.]|uniref:sodium-dependent bicarbonate transport family permease n=3 Tax=Litorivivens sp. TaxID=2020868 RepID=UPI0035646391